MVVGCYIITNLNETIFRDRFIDLVVKDLLFASQRYSRLSLSMVINFSKLWLSIYQTVLLSFYGHFKLSFPHILLRMASFSSNVSSLFTLPPDQQFLVQLHSTTRGEIAKITVFFK